MNVGPTAEGVFPDAINQRLAEIGAWMKVNGESVYGTTKSPFREIGFDGRVTAKGNALYLEVFKWPEGGGGVTLSGLKTPVASATTLDGHERLKLAKSQAGGISVLTISRPGKIDPVATVVRLQLSAAPVVDQPRPPVKAEADGTFALKAADAELHGKSIQYDWQGLSDERDYIGSWKSASDYVSWTFALAQAGRYRVEVVYQCPPENAGSQFTVGAANGATLSGTVQATVGVREFRTDALGELDLSAGERTLAVRITSLAHGEAMNLHQVRLVPVH